MSRYVLKTLGCKANLHDSQNIENTLQQKGWIPLEKGGDDEDVQLCIINSCTVTDEADRQTRKLAARLARDNPKAKVVVTGCGAEVDPEGLIQSKGVHYVVGNQDKDRIVDLLLTSDILQPDSQPQILGKVQNYHQILSRHPAEREWPITETSFQAPPTNLSGYSEKTRSFIKIQEGCNSFCTYCIIPYGRGPSRSLRPRAVIEQINGLVADGVREVVITGTNIGDYGCDWGPEPALDALLEMILTQTKIERLRVGSLDPTEITPRMMELMAGEPRFCPHFHVSLQSPHSRILRLMKRKYSFEHVQTCLENISKIPSPLGGVFVGMDVITGFPGETQEEFQWTYDTLSALPWTRLHVFPYSERKGTPATRLPDSVPVSQRSERTKKLFQLSMDRLTQHYRKILAGMEKANKSERRLYSVLLEKGPDSRWFCGYTPNYLRVMIRNDENSSLSPNQLVTVEPLELVIDSKAGDVAFLSKVCM